MEFWLHVSDGFKETCKAPIVCKLPFLKKNYIEDEWKKSFTKCRLSGNSGLLHHNHQLVPHVALIYFIDFQSTGDQTNILA